MPIEVKSCPKCGAMIVAQLARCRQCKTYLHGTRLEGFLLEQMIPEQVRRAPGTATLCIFICLYYGLMLVLGGKDAIIGLSSFTLQQLGATHGPSVMQGQYWRFVTSIFGHHDLLHLTLNLWALIVVADLVEQIFDTKKMILFYLSAGVASMAISHVWYSILTNGILVVSAGASGAVCGLIGAALFGARKLGPRGVDVERTMRRWAAIMVIWGFLAPGINNAAHFGGFVVGALLARLTPAGLTQSVSTQKALSIAMLGSYLALIGSTILMIQNLHGFPITLESDARPRVILGHTYYEGYASEFSDQVLTWQSCADAIDQDVALNEAIHRCELNIRVNPNDAASYGMLASLLEKNGNLPRATKLRELEALIKAIDG